MQVGGIAVFSMHYTVKSFKAKFTRDGNKVIKEYCIDRKLPIYNYEKVVVASREEDIPSIEELKQQGGVNGIELTWLDECQTAKIDPEIKFYKKKLYILLQLPLLTLFLYYVLLLARELSDQGVKILLQNILEELRMV